MSEIKIVQASRNIQAQKKDQHLLYSDLESTVNTYLKDGWEIVGNGPERDTLLKRNWIVELLRAIPIINVFINWFFPLEVQSSISVIIKK